MTLDSIGETALQSIDADAAINRTIDEFVLPESREAMLDFSNLDTLGDRLKATPHNYCRAIALADFSSDCTN